MNATRRAYGIRESVKDEITLEFELEKCVGIHQRLKISGRTFG